MSRHFNLKFVFVFSILLIVNAIATPIPIQLDNDLQASIQVTVSNPSSSQSLLLVTYESPLLMDSSRSFVLRNDQTELEYTGAIFKRRFPPSQADAFIVLAPQASHTRTVDFREGFDLQEGADYTVDLHPQASIVGLFVDTEDLESVSLPSLLEAGHQILPFSSLSSRRSSGVTFRATESTSPWQVHQRRASRADAAPNNCTDAQASAIISARDLARRQTEWVKGYTDEQCANSGYTRWFGDFQAERYSTVSTCVANIEQLVHSDYGANWLVDCTLKNCGADVYAFVYPTQVTLPKIIHGCNIFFQAPSGWPERDTNGGTLIHEMSHFRDICATADIAYGVEGCQGLSDDRAAANADCYEYFAEFKPEYCATTSTTSTIPATPSPASNATSTLATSTSTTLSTSTSKTSTSTTSTSTTTGNTPSPVLLAVLVCIIVVALTMIAVWECFLSRRKVIFPCNETPQVETL